MSAGNLSNISQEDLIFPSFISRREDGVFVDLPGLQKTGGFELFVERMFTTGSLFSELDYASFLKLLYDADWLMAEQTQRAELKIAAKITPFLPQRQALYKEPKVSGGGKLAEYVFEPVSIEETYEEPVYGAPDESGVAPVIKMESKTRQLPAKLDFDEFVAAMWLKGVKFGIEVKAVRQAIASSTSERLTIAQCLEPTAGQDAAIAELRDDMRCDNSPKILANGKADLHSRKNRFPQIHKETLLLKKVARVLGKPGFKVTGEIIEPAIPKDMDLSVLAAEGTCVKQLTDGEYVVSAMDGFLMFDEKTNKVSVSEKIENKAGVSAQTTVNLDLDVDEYIEHGEVQEVCVVKGRHMTFLADVFGNIISQRGNIFLAKNLSGGSAEALDGNITLGMQASRALVRARAGEVKAAYCENSTIVGKTIYVEHAVNCELIADKVFAENIEGCIVAAKSIKITSANEFRGQESLVTLLLPDQSEFNRNIAKQNAEIAETQKAIEVRMQKIELLKSDAGFAKYLGLYERIKSGAIKLTHEQAISWRNLMGENAIMVNKLAKLNAEIDTLNLSRKEFEDNIISITRERDKKEVGISCTIEAVVGKTVVQTMRSIHGVEALGGMPGKEIRVILQKMDSHKMRVFSDGSGSVNWSTKKPEDS